MRAIFLKDLKLTRKGLYIWISIMILTAVMGAAEYPMMSENIDSIVPSLQMMPKIVRIMFGVEGLTFQHSIDYYISMYFWYCLIAFTHAAYVGATIIAKEERDKTGEFLFTKPYKRSDIITSKILVGVLHVFSMALATWLVTITTLLPLFDGESVFGIVSITISGMFMTQIVFLALGLLCTALFKKYKTGVSVSMLIVLVSFTIAIMFEYLGNVDYLNFLSPFRYFNVKEVIIEGISLIYVLIAAVIVGISIYLTYNFYDKKDLLA